MIIDGCHPGAHQTVKVWCLHILEAPVIHQGVDSCHWGALQGDRDNCILDVEHRVIHQDGHDQSNIHVTDTDTHSAVQLDQGQGGKLGVEQPKWDTTGKWLHVPHCTAV